MDSGRGVESGTHEELMSLGGSYSKLVELKSNPNVKYFRAGLWKPRTRPNSFEGVGEEGMRWLSEVSKEVGIPVMTEVADAHHVELALKNGIDAVWIGARTTESPFSDQTIADALEGKLCL